jgi:hypothetical protein
MVMTAEDFLKNDNGFDDDDIKLLAKSLKTENRMDLSDIYQTMIEFAKLHREAILKAAGENADTIYRGDSFGDYIVDKDSILSAYPPENIK